MLKNFGYGGVYRDDDVTIGITLENPLDYDLSADVLAFEVKTESKHSGVDAPQTNGITLYIMDEDNRMYNARNTECKRSDTELNKHTWLITTDLKPELLYQAIRVAFYYKPHDRIHIIKLQH